MVGGVVFEVCVVDEDDVCARVECCAEACAYGCAFALVDCVMERDDAWERGGCVGVGWGVVGFG